MELIEREPLRTKAVECGKLAKQDPRLLVVGLGYVLDAPTIDAVPVVHGRWKDGHCTECGYGVEPWNNTPYCPSCGARMDGEEAPHEH